MKILVPNDNLNFQERWSDSSVPGHAPTNGDSEMASEQVFARMLCLERRRAERSRRQFLLLLLDAQELVSERERDEAELVLNKIAAALLSSTRETDLRGWYQHQSVLGAILTEIDAGNLAGTVQAVLRKIHTALLAKLHLNELNKIHLSFHLFPEDPISGSRASGRRFEALSGPVSAGSVEPAASLGQTSHRRYGQPSVAGSAFTSVGGDCGSD
jgi:hypothetical protein